MRYLTPEQVESLLDDDEDYTDPDEAATERDDRERRAFKRDMETWIQGR